MECPILGSFEVGGTDAVLDRRRGAKRRGLLACLMFHAGQPMSTDRLVEELWSVSGPDDAARRPAVLDDALALWRGPPLAEFAGSARVDQATTRLEALHVHSRQSRDDIRSEMEARRLLVDEAGIEPSPELVDLEHRVLAHDPTLVATADPRGNW